MKRTFEAITIAAMLMVLVFATQSPGKNTFSWRTVLWPSSGFGGKPGTEEGKKLLVRMNAAGYNGMILGGTSIRLLHKQQEAATNARDFAAEARKQGIEIIPMGQYQAWNDFVNPARPEALPTIGTSFVVSGGVALAKGDPSIVLTNSGFEQPLGKSNWRVSGPFSIDSGNKRPGSTGNFSLMCKDPGLHGTGKAMRVYQTITVKPFRTYELSVWIRSRNIVGIGRWGHSNPMSGVCFKVQGRGRYILHNREWAGVPRNRTWKQMKMRFNSVDNSNVIVSLHANYDIQYTGTVWYDDAEIRELGLCETILQASMPVVVRNAAGKSLVEGKDFVVGEERLTIPAGSTIKDGDEVTVDWFTKGDMFSRKPETAYCYDEVYHGMRQEINEIDKVFGVTPARLMMYDEWRMAGWDPVCLQRYDIVNLGAGKYMAEVANTTAELYKEANGNRVALAWNDPYDPYHNSRASYMLTNGGSLGSGHYLSEDLIIVNWNGSNRKQSLLYFAGTNATSYGVHGTKTTKQRQIISCHTNGLNDWLKKLGEGEAEGELPDGSVIGVNYHTYQKISSNAYQSTHIEDLANICKAAGRWETGPIPLPAAAPGIPWKGLAGIAQDQQEFRTNVSLLRMNLTQAGAVRNLNYTVPSSNNVQVAIVNLCGQKIMDILDEHVAAGTHQRKIDVSQMAPGVYFATLKVNGQSVNTVTRKLVVH